MLLEVLEIARGIEDKSNRARVLTGLASLLPEVLPEALDVVRAIKYENSRAEALTGLAPYLPESLLLEVLEIARGIGDKSNRAKALTGLASHLPEVLPEALEAARGIGDEYDRPSVLQELTKVLTPTNVDRSLWEKKLHTLGILTRPSFLETIPNLVPLILHFGGVVALREAHQGIREVSRWWR